MEHAADFGGEIRVFGPSGIEDYHAHLFRLDRASRFPGLDDRGIDSHCLWLVASGAVFVGFYADGALRAGAHLVADRCARHGQAVITAEEGFAGRDLEQALSARLIEEARRRRLRDLTVLSPSDAQTVYIAELAVAV